VPPGVLTQRNLGTVEITGRVELRPASHQGVPRGLAGLVAWEDDLPGRPRTLQLVPPSALPAREQSDFPPIWVQNLVFPPCGRRPRCSAPSLPKRWTVARRRSQSTAQSTATGRTGAIMADARCTSCSGRQCRTSPAAICRTGLPVGWCPGATSELPGGVECERMPAMLQRS